MNINHKIKILTLIILILTSLILIIIFGIKIEIIKSNIVISDGTSQIVLINKKVHKYLQKQLETKTYQIKDINKTIDVKCFLVFSHKIDDNYSYYILMLKHEITFWYKPTYLNRSVVLLTNIANKIIANELNIKDDLFFDVIIVNNEQIKKINSKFRHINKVTDVISFALRDSNKSIKVNLLGEIYLAPDYICNIAKSDFKKVFIFTYIHGVLHLLSYDHKNKEQEKKMFDLQDKILRKIKF